MGQRAGGGAVEPADDWALEGTVTLLVERFELPQDDETDEEEACE